jgi:hypothetical protein
MKQMTLQTARLASRAHLRALAGLTILFGLTSCASNDELQERLDRRTEANANYQERRKMRRDANDARDAAWYDRVMH